MCIYTTDIYSHIHTYIHTHTHTHTNTYIHTYIFTVTVGTIVERGVINMALDKTLAPAQHSAVAAEATVIYSIDFAILFEIAQSRFVATLRLKNITLIPECMYVCMCACMHV